MDTPLTAILSDLHGNLPALEVALADAFVRGARRFVCLGDVVGYGARPADTLERIMPLCSGEPVAPDGQGPLEPGLCLQGNHEYALLVSAEGFNPKARAAIDWTRDALNQVEDRPRSYALWDFLGELRPRAHDGQVLYAHGSPRDPVREYLLPRDSKDGPKMRAVFAHQDAPVCFVGHSHVPAVYHEDLRLHLPNGDGRPYDLCGQADGRAIVNVGSVGQPRDGDPRLSYALYDGSSVTFVRLEYDIARAMAEIRAVPELPDYLAERLAVGR